MKQGILKFVGVLFMLAFCIAILPVQEAEANEKLNVLTDEELERFYFANWSGNNYAVRITKDEGWGALNEFGDFYANNYTYLGVTLRDGVNRCLHYTDGNNNYYVDCGSKILFFREAEPIDPRPVSYCETGSIEERIEKFVAEHMAAEGTKAEDTTVDEPVVEESKNEEVKSDVSGRTVQDGETVYIVKKNDCLWNIAKQLLGDGKKYTELFIRNNDIIKKAELIYPGQEVIIPATK